MTHMLATRRHTARLTRRMAVLQHYQPLLPECCVEIVYATSTQKLYMPVHQPQSTSSRVTTLISAGAGAATTRATMRERRRAVGFMMVVSLFVAVDVAVIVLF